MTTVLFGFLVWFLCGLIAAYVGWKAKVKTTYCFRALLCGPIALVFVTFSFLEGVFKAVDRQRGLWDDEN